MPFSGYDDLNSDFSFRLQAFIYASGGRVYPTSGYRSPERQQQLWAQALRKYGDPEIADNWVARPGHSNHERGMATDLGFADAAARQWAHDNAARFGLHFPMSWEPWHIEPLGSVSSSSRGAYTTAPGGFVNPRDAFDNGLNPLGESEDPHDPGVQMRRLFAVIEAGGEAATGQVNTPTSELGTEAPTSSELVGGEAGGVGEGGMEPEAAMAKLVQEL